MNACQKNDALLRQMIKNGYSLTKIAKAVGTNRTRLKEHICAYNIPHEPFLTTNFGAKNGRWAGGRVVDKDGYILIKKRSHPNCDRHGYVREHRLVMEKSLDRYLSAAEVVHHLDKDKRNNSIENLGLFAKNSDHLKHELTGHVPNWTDDGKARIKSGIKKSAANRLEANRQK